MIALGTPQQLIATVGGETLSSLPVGSTQVPKAGPGAPDSDPVRCVVDAAQFTAIPGCSRTAWMRGCISFR